MRSRSLVAISLLLCTLSAWAQGPRFDGVRVNLWPTPRVAPADGKTSATIRAELRDANGRPVADGTTVVFRVEGGELSLGGNERRQAVTATTSGGNATVYVTSAEPGVATVYAEVATGEGKNQVTIAFVEEGSALLGDVGAAHVRGGWVGYALDLGLIEARDHAEVEFGPIHIFAEDLLQLDVNTLTVKATGARLEVEGRCLAADELSYNLVSGQGLLRRIAEGGIEELCFDCYSLEPRPPEDESFSADQIRPDAVDAGAWAVAKGISVYPQQKIVLRNATVYAGAQKLIDLPRYWIIAMPGYTGSSHSGVLGVNSSGEIAVDFPYFYRVSETRTGALKIQHGAAAGSVIARDDWSLALEEAYDTGAAQGAASLVGLPRDDWGFQWHDQRRLGRQRDGYFTLYSPDHEDWYFDANVYQWSGRERINFTTSVQIPRDEGESYAAGVDWLSTNRPLGVWDASYRLGTAAGVRHAEGYDEGLVGTHQVYAALDFPQRLMGERTSITPALSNLFTWDTAGYQQNSIRGELRLHHVFTSDKSIWLSYQGRFTSGDNADGYEHLVNLDLRAYHGARFSSYATATYDLSEDDLYAFALVDYSLDRDWRVGVASTFYDIEDTTYDDIEITVARRFGSGEIGLRWSEASGRVALEVGGFSGLGF